MPAVAETVTVDKETLIEIYATMMAATDTVEALAGFSPSPLSNLLFAQMDALDRMLGIVWDPMKGPSGDPLWLVVNGRACEIEALMLDSVLADPDESLVTRSMGRREITEHAAVARASVDWYRAELEALTS